MSANGVNKDMVIIMGKKTYKDLCKELGRIVRSYKKAKVKVIK